MERKTILLDEGWAQMIAGFEKLEVILAGEPGAAFLSDEHIHLYTTIYNMCTQKPPYDYSQQLYDRYKQVLAGYITVTVLPSFHDKHGEFLLKELVFRWKNHELMVRWLSRFFYYLDRYYITRRSLESLKNVGWNSFRTLVIDDLKATVTSVLIAMVDEDREGQIIDRTLVKNVLDIYIELDSECASKLYNEDFEDVFLKATIDYYSKKAQDCIGVYSLGP